MEIKNLSSAQAHGYGKILRSRPDADLHIERRQVNAGDAVAELYADAPVIVDYVSGMSLLVIYESESYRLYYLDRVFELCAGLHFSVVTLDGSCSYDLCICREDALCLARTHPAERFQNPASDLKLNRLLTFFYQECARDFYFRGEQHDAFELVYVDAGTLHNIVGGTDLLLTQQQLLLIDRNLWHMQYADLPVNFLTISFKADIYPCSSLCRHVWTLTARQVDLVRLMLTEYNADEFAYDCVESLLRLLLVDLLRSKAGREVKLTKRMPATAHADQRIVDKLIQIVSSGTGQKMTLQQLADAAHISTTYLHRIFRTQLGMTPGTYLSKIRIEESKLLLRNGELSMGEISKQLGFSSQQHFSRQFRSVTGLTPSEYVKTLR
ncbi:MAG: AraC family transcriptional regulator [Clostridia bacterium]|nr:AraC family transcriptional regulator [Clostridia bacterium]